MGIYEVEFQGVKVKAVLVDNQAVLDAKIFELWTSLKNQGCPVVGIDVKVNASKKAELLILSGMNHCLIIKLAKIQSSSYSLMGFLEDKTICFVGIGIPVKVPSLTLPSLHRGYDYPSGKYLIFNLGDVVEVCELAAKVLKNTNLCKCGMADLDREVRRINNPVAEIACPDWEAAAFSDEEIKYVVYEAYTCCFIGCKMFGLLENATT